MAKDFAGREIERGDIVVQAAASGHHKYLKVAIVLEIISDSRVKVQSESRPGIVDWADARLLILDEYDFLLPDRLEELYRIYYAYIKKQKEQVSE